MTEREREIMMLLPEGEAPSELVSWATQRHTQSNLGGHKIIFRRESVEIAPELKQTMDGEDWEQYDKGIKRHWGAECNCTCCWESFTAGYAPDSKLGIKGIVLLGFEDGQLVDGWTKADDDNAVIFSAGELMNCPLCGQEAELLPKSSIRGSKTYRVLVLEVRNLEGLTTLIYWDISRTLSDDGYFTVSSAPFSAVVLDGKKLIQYDHLRKAMFGVFVQDTHWHVSFSVRDPEQMRYQDADSINGTKIGAVLWSKVPKQTGCSAEKTGLEAYLKATGPNPVLYLKLWAKHPNAENIIKSEWGRAFVNSVSEQAETAYNYGQKLNSLELEGVDWKEKKPHRMLGLSREDYRKTADAGWSLKDLQRYKEYTARVESYSVDTFTKWGKLLGHKELEALITAGKIPERGDLRLSKVINYLHKQKDCTVREGAELLMDYRRMLDVAPERVTHEQLWPRRLRAAHDEAAKFYKKDGDHYRQAKFDETAEKYAGLEWNDGHICVRLPRCNGELIAEGNTLRHCVGSYADTHLEGKLVLFIRHWRRPERSWYTLNIDMTGDKPKRLQLHGYGNERHGKNKEHAHKIPQEVKDFCERWENEVLAPWFYAQKKAEARIEKQIKKKRSDAA